jgi:hypothetical protein
MKQWSEPVTSGGLTGQGFVNLLGRPRLGPVPLLLREAVQNTWDARRPGVLGIRFCVRVRTLAAPEEREFRRIFGQKDSSERFGDNALAQRLQERGVVKVLELADFGTWGLCGITRPDLPTEGPASRFVNFFFDVGRAHADSGDGGTYGFGRSCLYTAGTASLILVDSLVEEDGALERRLMACRIGPAFQVAKGSTRGRYSGRHFWGRERKGICQPLLDSSAAEIADRLGMPHRRTKQETGTTILIPWPVEGFEKGNVVVATILHHLWPKMVPRDGFPTMSFEVELDGRRHSVPDPESVPEYRPFVQALRKARTRSDGPLSRVITTLRPRHVTGCLGLVETSCRAVAPVTEREDDEEMQAPTGALNSIALMRPSELVVRYLPVPGAELPGRSWAGVFICEDNLLVRTAFAKAEPPAHDDWIPDRLQDKTEKYLVRKTVQMLPDAVRELLGVRAPGPADEPSSTLSLGGVSARFASAFLSGDGQGAARDSGREPGGARPRPPRVERQVRVSAPVPLALRMQGEATLGVFRATLQGPKGAKAFLRATPRIFADGRSDMTLEGVAEPKVVVWDGKRLERDTHEVTLESTKRDVEIGVVIPGEYGVVLELSLSGDAG